SAADSHIPVVGRQLVLTELQAQPPPGHYLRVAPRSDLTNKHGITVGAGLVDANYTGNIGVVLFNHGQQDFSIRKGDRIAQLICERICYLQVREVEQLETTQRGASGYGSTGK
ncbi:DUT nucleotidohydrolase, partial [Polyodon spathula]|nr:DUT nucleotidohydrolase [Polyodon spathula]